MTDDQLPPGMTRAAMGVILTLVGCICASAAFFYLIYRLYFAMHWRHHR